MTALFADGVEINIEEGHWRLYNLEGSNSLSPFFDVLRGSGILSYVASFGKEHGLPGTVLAGDYVRAVVVGFDERNKRWLLGLHVAGPNDLQPRWIEVIRWPFGEEEKYATDSHQAGRILAEYLVCPLKLFGAKKLPGSGPDGKPRPGVTGPLTPHQRQDVDIPRVRVQAQAIHLPIAREGVWIGGAHDMIHWRIAKDSQHSKQASGGVETPAYSQGTIDQSSQAVRLVPPTGLLGTFLGPQGRTIAFAEIRNVELRRTVIHESSIVKDEDGMSVDQTRTNHLYGVYLTLSNESVLVAQLRHVITSDLTRHRARTGISAVGKGKGYDAEAEMAYLRQHAVDQQDHDETSMFVESMAVVMAAAIGRTLVKTEVVDSPD
ncbi:MAG TPA: hypothetical protein VKQ72_15630 [Aggregatilineales bacterium]|nr:hypothetical protein [Aggregatilineales bacterium]